MNISSKLLILALVSTGLSATTPTPCYKIKVTERKKNSTSFRTYYSCEKHGPKDPKDKNTMDETKCTMEMSDAVHGVFEVECRDVGPKQFKKKITCNEKNEVKLAPLHKNDDGTQAFFASCDEIINPWAADRPRCYVVNGQPGGDADCFE